MLIPPFNQLDPFSLRILEAIPDALMIVNTAGQIVLVNAQALQIFGFDQAEQLLHQPLELLIPETLREQHREHLARYFAAPAVRDMAKQMQVPGWHQAGHEIALEIALSPIALGAEAFAIAIVRDISERLQMLEKLHYFSMHDALTGLYNRAYFEEECDRIAQSRRFPVSMLVLDLDGLKTVNDTQGHAAGDQLLCQMAAVLRQSFRADDMMARLGGDEFVVLLPETDAAALQRYCQRLDTVLLRYNAAEQANLQFSYGGATAVNQVKDLNALYREADAAMYRHKRARKASLSAGL
ncbi:MAG: GGDEF domain-containing protein [Candidatus Sericytochromatia bacterium]|nr:GGDEF domain-containing protein [Candidatus Sericytochromatia bacterium]